VPAPVVSEAAVIARKFRDLVFPVFESVDLAVNEDKVRPIALELVVEIAAIRLDGRHDVALVGEKVDVNYRAGRAACQRCGPRRRFLKMPKIGWRSRARARPHE
jgi:hypothetical protein